MANETIPNLPPAISITGNELVEIVQGGVNKRASLLQVGTGFITLPLAISEGGTGQTTAPAALQALLPSYGGNAGLVLKVNGTATGTEWGSTYPALAGNANKFLAVNSGETGVEWDSLPSPYPALAGNANKVLTVNSGETGVEWDSLPPADIRQITRGATFVSTQVLAPPINDVFVSPGFNCTIKGYRMYTTGGSGSCVVDVRKSTYAAFPPVGGDTICGGNKPTITADISASDFTLTGWGVSVSSTDVLGFSLESSSTFTSVTIQLFLEQA